MRDSEYTANVALCETAQALGFKMERRILVPDVPLHKGRVYVPSDKQETDGILAKHREQMRKLRGK